MGACLSVASKKDAADKKHTDAPPESEPAVKDATTGTPKTAEEKRQAEIDEGAAAQAAAYNPNDTSIPLGLRTNFGYSRDFTNHYTLGRELGHGQFGTTYESIKKSTGDKVAVKAIQKKTVSKNGQPSQRENGLYVAETRQAR